MQYLAIYWSFLIVFFALIFIGKLFRINALSSLIKHSDLVLIISLPFLIVAIATNDPIEILGIELSKDLQWLGSLLVAGFGSWQFYLRPLKERVITTEKDVHAVKTDINSIKEDISIIKQKLMNK